MDLPISPEFTEVQPDDSAPMEGETAPESVTIPTAAAVSAGLASAQPGDTFTATLTITSSDEMGVGVQISEASPAGAEMPPEEIEEPEEMGMGPRSKSRTLGPEALGLA